MTPDTEVRGAAAGDGDPRGALTDEASAVVAGSLERVDSRVGIDGGGPVCRVAAADLDDVAIRGLNRVAPPTTAAAEAANPPRAPIRMARLLRRLVMSIATAGASSPATRARPRACRECQPHVNRNDPEQATSVLGRGSWRGRTSQLLRFEDGGRLGRPTAV